jgi:hypothetical protein
MKSHTTPPLNVSLNMGGLHTSTSTLLLLLLCFH